MKSSNKLNKALKDALDGNPAPLHEPQWERLLNELGEKKTKPKAFSRFWLMLPMIVGAIIVAYFIGRQSGIHEIATVSSSKNDSFLPSKNSENAVDQAEDNTLLSEDKKNLATENATKTEYTKNALSKPSSIPENSGLNTKTDEAGTTAMVNAQNHETIIPSSVSSSNETKNIQSETKQAVESVQSTTEFNYNEKSYSVIKEIALIQVPLSATADSMIEVNKKVAFETKEKEEKEVVKRPRFAIGISSGFSPVITSIRSLSNDNKLHKDTRFLFEENNKNQNSIFGNLSFEWLISSKLNLGLSGGIQYREISNDVDITYKYNEVPFRHPDGEIAFYIHIEDTMNPQVMQLRRTNTSRFIMLPIRLSYGFLIREKNELQFSGGLILSSIITSKSDAIDLSEGRVRPVSEMIKSSYNIGYTGGLLYSRNVYGAWWLGAEAQFQNNNIKYNMGYGILNSKIKINNFNLNIRYKF